MKFEEVLPALREMKKVRHKGWGNQSWWRSANSHITLTHQELCSDDWEIVEETLTWEQAKQAMREGKWILQNPWASPLALLCDRETVVMYRDGKLAIKGNIDSLARGNYLLVDKPDGI